MIFSAQTTKYYNSLNSRVIKGMALNHSKTPYFIKDEPIIRNYECLRDVWHSSLSISTACSKHNMSRSAYYQVESKFVEHGLAGLFDIAGNIRTEPVLESLVLLIKECRPSLSHVAILRIAQAVPLTKDIAGIDLISDILTSYGYGQSNLSTDRIFWGRIQRTLSLLQNQLKTSVKGRKISQRKDSFFANSDPLHKKLECLRTLYFDHSLNMKETCLRFNLPISTYYRLLEEYLLYGPWAILSASSYGKNESISSELQLTVLLNKLEHPALTAQQITDKEKLYCSRYVVNRIIKRWGLEDKTLKPMALDRFISDEIDEKKQESFTPFKTAFQIVDEKNLLQTHRINRHFELICKKMNTHKFHICDPGPFMLAPFVNDLGIVQAFETYGPEKLRGKEITNLALLNVFRILAGFRRINHLNNNKDRSVALASGIGMFGSCSKFYEDTIEFKFDQLQKMRCDLVARAKELGIIEGLEIGFDFHFKEFYGQNSEEQGIGKGPAKSGDLVAGFRPHVAWDLATNAIISIAYYQGSIRSPKIIRQFCEQNIFPIFDPLAIEEIYMDSEYTKESDFQYFKEIKCKNGQIYLCLKQNKQIQKFIAPALQGKDGWKIYPQQQEDEYKLLKVILPKTKLPLVIVILRDSKTKKNIRCFGTTNMDISASELLKKYRYRWIIENGLKDLVYSYYLDEIYGKDPEKIEFEFYCVMVARLAYEYFLRTLGNNYLNKNDGNKFTLNTMRDLLFEKRNCTIHQDTNKDIVLTILDTHPNKLIKDMMDMFKELKDNGKNKVLWWNNRGVILTTKNQFDIF